MITTRAKRIIFLLSVYLIILNTNLMTCTASGDSEEALSVYANADDTIKIAVNSLSKLTTTDRSIINIKTNLNEAAYYLDASWTAIMNQDYENSIRYSQTAQRISADVLKEISALDKPTSGLGKILDLQITYTLVEAITLSVIMFTVLEKLKTFYVKMILNSKLEVNKDES